MGRPRRTIEDTQPQFESKKHREQDLQAQLAEINAPVLAKGNHMMSLSRNLVQMDNY